MRRTIENKAITALRALIIGNPVVIRGYEYRLIQNELVVIAEGLILESEMPLDYFIILANELTDDEAIKLALDIVAQSNNTLQCKPIQLN